MYDIKDRGGGVAVEVAATSITPVVLSFSSSSPSSSTLHVRSPPRVSIYQKREEEKEREKERKRESAYVMFREESND